MGDQASLTRSCHASLYLNSVSRDAPGIEVLPLYRREHGREDMGPPL